MLKELSKVAIPMLFLGGYVTDAPTLRRLARDALAPRQNAQRGKAAHGDARRGALESLSLVAIGGGSLACVALGALVLAGLPLLH